MKILILNGPNLNMLGKREPEIYGSKTLDNIETECRDYASLQNIEVDFFQSNCEGELVDKIQSANENYDALIINAGAFTHTSIALHDALNMLNIKIIELHISNIFAREEFRHKSFISQTANAVICGLGTDGYLISIKAVESLVKNL